MLIICLIEKYVFAVPALRRPFFKYAFFADPVLGTEPLPKNGTHCKRNKISLQAIDFNKMIYTNFGFHIVPVELSLLPLA